MKEQLRRKLSAILMDTDEQHPLNCRVVVGESEAVGLSSLQLPVVVSVFQQPSEGIIWFNIEDCKEPIEFDDMDLNDIINIINYFENEKY